MIKLPGCHKENRVGILPGLRDCLIFTVSGTLMLLILREVKASQLLMEKHLREQQQQQKRLQDICERVLSMVEQLDQKWQSSQFTDTITYPDIKQSGMATRPVRPKKDKPVKAGETPKQRTLRARKQTNKTASTTDEQPQRSGGGGVGE